MQTLKAFLDQSVSVWRESTAAARLGIVMLALLGAGAVIAVGIWSMQPNYVTLASGLDHHKSTQLMAALDQANIAFQIKGAGSMILVDKREFNQASVLAGARGIGTADIELESTSPWMDPVNQQNILRRNLERQLAHSIQRYASVESAVVHLSIPERQPFLRQSVDPSASVVLEIAANQAFGESQAVAVAQLVANAVPGMRVDQVAISDTSGKLYTHDESLRQLTNQEEYRIHRERELTSKAEGLLVNFLGIGNARVEVTADFDFPEGRTMTTEYDPDRRVATSETVDSSTTYDETSNPFSPTGAGGGTSTNRASSGKQVTSKSEVVNSQYQVSSTQREAVERTPVLRVLTISVLVNSQQVQNESQEIPASVRTSIEAMVKQAVGFREGVDQFNLEFFDFVELTPADAAPVSAVPWNQLQNILKNVSLGLAALVAVYLGRRTLKHLQPGPPTAQTSAATLNKRDSQLTHLSDLVKQNPEVFSKILAAWANESPENAKSQTARKAA